MFLVDTNVISVLAPYKRGEEGALVQWLDRASPYLFLSVVSAAEVAAGIAKAHREGATTKVRALRDWWSAIEYLYSDRLLPFDVTWQLIAGTRLFRRGCAFNSENLRPGVLKLGASARSRSSPGFQLSCFRWLC